MNRVISVNIGGENSLTIYPNPATNYINIPGLGQEATVTIYDASGRQVLEGHGSKFSIKGLSKGLYLVIITKDGKRL
ncbi:Por secretion system C-terminal sorting domain-containing protein [Arachidicoccus rhizosphaerae]|uniref:Por secretion system C-terminal sorting domain-containing protein n=1 Tax=Arachidicoccus rhizosphaerae TaxID=551991 RepID=A0A1H4ADA4_9BACT|nr:T9SS type A sorting domain-containing protein [Arachidicoccus rhizosphaerae]SEA33711.1 Por secretion system C-terminal sorting domain-containing protein [Arachidicoccus rhizosphaerae]